MAFPLAPIAIAIVHGTTQVMTKPWPWILAVSWLAVAKFDVRVFGEEVRTTLTSLWWVLALILIGWIALASIKSYIQERGKTARFAIKEGRNL